jgi:D-arabinose 1-dehydrogenase-like Zn-dependent alcohol dehydrogenase
MPLPVRPLRWLLPASSVDSRATAMRSWRFCHAETQEMLDFCGTHNLTADVEVILIQKVSEAYERLLKSDAKYRFSIDMASIKSW